MQNLWREEREATRRREIFQKHPLSTRLSYFTTHKTHSLPDTFILYACQEGSDTFLECKGNRGN